MPWTLNPKKTLKAIYSPMKDFRTPWSMAQLVP